MRSGVDVKKKEKEEKEEEEVEEGNECIYINIQ